MVQLATQRFELPLADQGDWLEYAVRTAGRGATFVVGGRLALNLDCPRPPHGQVGFFISSTSVFKGSVLFRRLRVSELQRAAGTMERTSVSSAAFADVQEADRLARRNRKEEASLLLLRARRGALDLANDEVRVGLLQSIDEKLLGSDPVVEERRVFDAAAAAELLSTAGEYQDAGWNLVALELAERAAEFDPFASRELLDRCRSTVALLTGVSRGWPAEPAQPADNALLVQMFGGGEQPVGKQAEWKVDDNGITAPTTEGDAVLLSKSPVSGSTRFKVQTSIGTQDREFGLHFAVQDFQADHLLEVIHDGVQGLTRVALLYRAAGEEYRVLGSKDLFFLPEALDSWTSLAVELGPSQVTIRVGRAPAFTIQTPVPLLSGLIGLRARTLGSRAPVHFRNLVIGG
jgi:hypothetical protein